MSRHEAADLNWKACHHCGDTLLDGQAMEVDNLECQQWITCSSCDATWIEVYVAGYRVDNNEEHNNDY